MNSKIPKNIAGDLSVCLPPLNTSVFEIFHIVSYPRRRQFVCSPYNTVAAWLGYPVGTSLSRADDVMGLSLIAGWKGVTIMLISDNNNLLPSFTTYKSIFWRTTHIMRSFHATNIVILGVMPQFWALPTNYPDPEYYSASKTAMNNLGIIIRNL